jgi:hypothetical protein
MPRALTEPFSMPHVHVGVLASPVRHQTPRLTRLECLPTGRGISVFQPLRRASPPAGGADSERRHPLSMQEDSPTHHQP